LTPSKYQIERFNDDQAPEVVTLLCDHLWHQGFDENLSHFIWKYKNNPSAEQSLGMVATYRGTIVGFRGYFATDWTLGNAGRRTSVLMPGDTVVHPEHRRKGLSVAMGRQAMQHLTERYRVLLNTTAGKNSIPGYLRLGFVPLHTKAYYRRSSLLTDIKIAGRILSAKGKDAGATSSGKAKIRLGTFGHIEVAQAARPQEMARIASRGNEKLPHIALLQNEAFYRWRYANPKGRYVFFFHRSNDTISAYLVMSMSGDARQGFIVDTAEEIDGQIGALLDHIVDMAAFDEVNILNLSVDAALWESLRTRGFTRWGLHRTVKKLVFGERPLLVRPVRPDFDEDDWFLDGLDIRKISNWRFKQICQDDV
jgi:GNAT superfamily N-acetyltransferase